MNYITTLSRGRTDDDERRTYFCKVFFSFFSKQISPRPLNRLAAKNQTRTQNGVEEEQER